MTNETKFEWIAGSCLIAGLIGFAMGGCDVAQKTTENLDNSQAIVYRDTKDHLEKIKVTIGNGAEIYLIKPEGYTNYVSSQYYKSTELSKLERKLNSEVNTK